jgi:pyruvate/2-oxoglutarate dehydrogenase complex dihydrolipoamide dehydrogenase (E3) component
VQAYDLVVLGAGATGLAAARSARRAGRRVALVEAARPGGDCTHYGCVPSKTLLETARRVAGARTAGPRGVTADVAVDLPKVLAHVQSVVDEIEQDESPRLLARQGIDLVAGWGRFLDPRVLDVDGRRLTAERFVLALGSDAAIPPVPGLDAVDPLTNRTVFGLRERPDSLLVLGGGPLGVELAQAFARLGVAVTVVEAGPRLLSKEEPEASRVVAEVLAREGVDVRVGVGAERAVRTAGRTTLTLADGSEVAASHLLVAAGRRPATGGCGLDAAGVVLDERGRVETDTFLRTSQRHIYAAGDCTAALQFTHVGDEQGRLAAANAFATPGRPGLLGGPQSWDDRAVPWATFTEPEIGRVGLTEAQAFERYRDAAQVAYVPASASDRARTAGATEGFVKLVAAPPRLAPSRYLLRLVGMTAVAPSGGEMVAEGALSMRSGGLVARIAQTVHAYPTEALSTRLAAAQFFGSHGGRGSRPARGDRG